MDLVYQGAEVTIVAATGGDANAELPGIENTPRKPQCVVQLGVYLTGVDD
jgi:hypothetical protein